MTKQRSQTVAVLPKANHQQNQENCSCDQPINQSIEPQPSSNITHIEHKHFTFNCSLLKVKNSLNYTQNPSGNKPLTNAEGNNCILHCFNKSKNQKKETLKPIEPEENTENSTDDSPRSSSTKNSTVTIHTFPEVIIETQNPFSQEQNTLIMGDRVIETTLTENQIDN